MSIFSFVSIPVASCEALIISFIFPHSFSVSSFLIFVFGFLLLFSGFIFCVVLIPMAVRSETRTVFDCLNTRIVGLNLAQGMDVCLCFSVLCCLV